MGIRALYRHCRRLLVPQRPLNLPYLPPLAPSEMTPLWPRVDVVDAERFDPEGFGRDVFVRRAASQDRPPPLPLLTTDPRVVQPTDVTNHNFVKGPSGDVGCFVLRNAIYDPGLFTALTEDGMALQAPELIPPYWAAEIERGQLRATNRRALDRPVDGIAIACLSSQYLSYGAFLLDTLPRLWVARTMLGPAWPKVRLLLDMQWPSWATGILAALGINPEQCLHLSRGAGRRHVRVLILPTPMNRNYRFHDLTNRFCDEVADAGPVSGPRHIYIPRPADDRLRHFDNQDAVIDIATQAGFEVVEPWTRPWPEQISLFRQARVVMGPFGSALHTALFSPAETRVVPFVFVNHLQSAIAGLRGQQMAYVSAALRPVEGNDSMFSVDPGAVRLAIDAVLSA